MIFKIQFNFIFLTKNKKNYLPSDNPKSYEKLYGDEKSLISQNCERLLNKMNDQCQTPTDIPQSDIATKTDELVDKLGGNQECKQSAKTDATNAATSAGASASASGFGAEVKGEVHAQASLATSSNSMEQSGCGTLIVAAQKIISNSKKIQCIMQKSSQSTEMDVGLNASIKIMTNPLTSQEQSDKAAAIKKWQELNPPPVRQVPKFDDFKNDMFSGMPVITDPVAFANMRTTLLKAATDAFNSAVKESADTYVKEKDSYDRSIASIQAAYSRDIKMEGVEIGQKISGKIKANISLSSQEAAKMETLTKQIASTVAQAAIEQKSGLNALSPNLKSVTDTTSETNENLSSTSINSKIQSTKVSIKMNNELLITAPGSLNMKNVKINQEIVADVAADVVISSAIDAGIKSASEMSSSSSVMNALKQESAGVDDLVRAQGEANAAAIQAAQITLPATSGAGIIGAIIVLAILFKYDTLPPNMKFAIDIILGVIVLGLLFCVYILYQNLTALLRYIRKLTGAEIPEDKAVLFKRPLEVYNKLWKEGYGFTKDLTVEDIINTIWTVSSNPDPIALENPDAPIGDAQIKQAMQNKYDLANAPGAYEEDILFCYMDGIIPLSLKKLKLKANKDLADDEIAFLWENVSKCDPSMFGKIIQGNYRTMKNIDEILTFMKKSYYDSVSVKKPKDLTEADIRFLWKYVGCIDNDSIFKKIVVEKDTLQKYTNLSSMDAVLAELKKNK